MNLFLLANSVFIVASVLYGWLAGNRQDREGVTWIVAAILGTLWAQSVDDQTIQVAAISIIDVALLIGMLSIALRCDRYWPIWFAGFHLATVVTNLVVYAAPQEPLLRVVGSLFGTPAILVMVVGIFLDRLAELDKRPLSEIKRRRSG